MALEMYDESDFDLRKYLQILSRHKWKVCLSGMIAGALALGFVVNLPDKYEASATISFDTGRANVVAIDEVYEGGNKNWEYLQTQVELIKSRQIIDKVITDLNLEMHPEFNPDLAKAQGSAELQPGSLGSNAFSEDGASTSSNGSAGFPSSINGTEAGDLPHANSITITEDLSSFEQELNNTEAAVDQQVPLESRAQGNTQRSTNKQALMKSADRPNVLKVIKSNLKVENISNTQLITVGYESGSPELSATVANAVASAYMDRLQNTENEIQNRANSWLSEKLANLRETLEGSEAKLFEFRQRENLVDMEGVRGLAAKELTDATAHLMEARRDLQRVANTREQIHSNINNPDVLGAMPAFQASTVIQGIKKQEAEARLKASELALRYGPKHPKMVAAKSELQAVTQGLNSELKQLVTGIDGEYQVALANEGAAEREFEKSKAEYQRVTEKDAQHEELQRQVEINRGLYNTFLTRLKETNQTSGLNSDLARIADPAVVPRDPIERKVKLIVALAIVLGLGVGVLIVLFIEFVYDGVKSSEDVDRGLGQNLFGVVPAMRAKSNGMLDLRTYFDAEKYNFIEAVRTLRTSLVLYHLESSGRVISVTSSVPEEGKTTVAINLGFSLAQIENVLLIDGDLRRPSIAKAFGLANSHPGLTDLIAENKTLEECIFHDKESGLDIMPAGTTPPDAQKVIGSVSFANSIKVLASLYDRIIIDTPPVRAVSDALLIGKLVDSRLYVIKANSTSKRWIRKGISRFSKSGLDVDGVVVNQIDASISDESFDYYSDQYGYGYTAVTEDVEAVNDLEQSEVVEVSDKGEGHPEDIEQSEASESDKQKLDVV
ncbi:capsular exopolysaccharide family [Microbulbifer donghaiensis]|uniref:non-specific protein-tyrosine kinase n=1 Tax=Microbulbifer donghaiensis TaxID=494016 RepID=A0A1M4ZYC4_9GAMM|nr:capsular exopolysaccharide family [Microbulbifer donghaiensis]